MVKMSLLILWPTITVCSMMPFNLGIKSRENNMNEAL